MPIACVNGMQEIQHRLEQRHDRVREHTAPHVNRRIDLTAQASADLTIRQGRNQIVRRIAELDNEWDVDRALMANFALAGGTALAVGLHRYTHPPLFGPRPKGFLYLVGAQMAFLMLHATVGWCPPVSLFRRLGYRTKSEIDTEREVLVRALEDGPSQSAA
jgi:hypothetical protein